MATDADAAGFHMLSDDAVAVTVAVAVAVAVVCLVFVAVSRVWRNVDAPRISSCSALHFAH